METDLPCDASMGELVDPADLKSAALCVPVRLRLLVPNIF